MLVAGCRKSRRRVKVGRPVAGNPETAAGRPRRAGPMARPLRYHQYAMITRRCFLASATAGAAAAQVSRPPLIETHLHLFSPDRRRFPYHPNAPYRPEPAPLEDYLVFAAEAGITGAVIVHPEPYQDDHSYLEYCFANEPSPMFFKGTCLFDPTDPATPDRMAELVERNPDRIVALRIHCTRGPDEPPTTSGPIRDRDLAHEMVRHTIRAATKLGLAIQFHITPPHVRQVHFLVAQFPRTTFLIDHLARPASGTAVDYAHILELAWLPNVYMKFSGVNYASREGYPYRDVRPLVRQVFGFYGADRMIWGGLGRNMGEYRRRREVFEQMFAFTTAADRAKIQGANARRLFWKQ